MGDLRAIVRAPEAAERLPGLVFVDGSGCGGIEEWDDWPEWIGDCGAVVLAHDKPGCGESPGDWRAQSFADRAAEALAAVEVLRGSAHVDSDRIGLIGWSQGGWVSLLAAHTSPDTVHQVVTISGPGVSMAEQERVRIGNALRAAGIDDHDAMAWVDDRTTRLRAGEPVADVIAAQQRLRDRRWYDVVSEIYDEPDRLAFFVRSMDVDPSVLLPDLRCPVLALFGGDDQLIPVGLSVARIAAALPGDAGHGIAVFPGGNHSLFTGPPVPGTSRRDQLAPGFLPMLTGFLAQGQDDHREGDQ
jgi:pimeloyl-ACP methyl ester carboxylesterase